MTDRTYVTIRAVTTGTDARGAVKLIAAFFDDDHAGSLGLLSMAVDLAPTDAWTITEHEADQYTDLEIP